MISNVNDDNTSVDNKMMMKNNPNPVADVIIFMLMRMVWKLLLILMLLLKMLMKIVVATVAVDKISHFQTDNHIRLTEHSFD